MLLSCLTINWLKHYRTRGLKAQYWYKHKSKHELTPLMTLSHVLYLNLEMKNNILSLYLNTSSSELTQSMMRRHKNIHCKYFIKYLRWQKILYSICQKHFASSSKSSQFNVVSHATTTLFFHISYTSLWNDVGIHRVKKIASENLKNCGRKFIRLVVERNIHTY
jgi:hypothetical protein